MQRKNKSFDFRGEFIVANVLGVASVAVTLLYLDDIWQRNAYLYGYLGGLVAGQIFAYITLLMRKFPQYRGRLRVVGLVLGFSYLIIAFASRSARSGLAYFMGLMTTFCFAWGIIALMRKLDSKPWTE